MAWPIRIAGLALFIWAAAANAQVAPPINESITRGAQIEDAVGRTARTTPRAVDDAALDGEAGVYILKKQDIFFVAGNASLGYSSNPLRTADNVGGSGSAQGSVSAGMRTRLGDAFDFSASLNLERTQYFRKFAPSNNIVSGSVTAGTGVRGTPIYLSVSGFGGWNLDEKYSNSVAFYGASGEVSADLPLGRRILLAPSLSATRQWSGTHENNNTSVSGRIALTVLRKKVSATLAAGVSHVWFDNFYEDVTFVKRRDWQYQADASIAYRATPKLILSANARYTRRDSGFFLASYRGFDGGVSVSAVLRF